MDAARTNGDWRNRQLCSTLNQMVQYSHIDRTLTALADPTRRSVLERLGRGSATITELAEPAGISLTGMKKHVRLLEEAGLVSTEKVGRGGDRNPRPRGRRDGGGGGPAGPGGGGAGARPGGGGCGREQ